MSEIENHCLLSVIVPCAPKDHAWKALLSDLQALPLGTEIVLVSPEEEPTESTSFWRDKLLAKLRWVQTDSGRAQCLNQGSLLARGQYFWFLHSDSKVPRMSTHALVEILRADDEWEDIFYFQHHFLGDGPKLVFLNSAVLNWRSKWMSWPMGQQGYAMHRNVFQALGGFREDQEYGEDQRLLWEARRKGVPVTQLPGSLFTSARRYGEDGWGHATRKRLLKESKVAVEEAYRLLKLKVTDI